MNTAPQLTGLLETALYVDDPERSARFYSDLFGFQRISEGERLIALSIVGRQVLLLFKKKLSAALPIAHHDGDGQLHLAFAIPAEELGAWETRLQQLGIAIEETKRWDRGGTSLYFRDPDSHLVELATPGVWTIY
jgi:catechol 2,3-dioxygenase-like lactoylglutathione lyase family enzyme